MADSPGTPIYEELRDALRAEEPVVLATVTAGTNLGAKLLARPDGRIAGTLGDPDLDRVVARDALGELQAGLTSTRHYGEHGEAREDSVGVFIESFAPPPRMIIFGAVDFTAALARVAKVLGYRVVVCDARAVFATRQRFPMADEVVNEWPDRYLEKVGDELGPATRCACSPTTRSSTFPPSSARWPPTSATSGPWDRVARTPSAPSGCAKPVSTTPGSRASTPRSVSTSAAAHPKRRRCRSAPRSSPSAPGDGPRR